MSRRSFDHFHAELSVEIGKLVPRYALWLRLRDAGLDPDQVATAEVVDFFDAHLDAFLAEEGLVLAPRRRTRLRRRLERYDPAIPTPYETMQRIFGGAR